MPYPRDEIAETLARYCELRVRIDAGEESWNAIAEFFTDDIVYIDPAWGRVEGIGALREFLDASMRGLENWEFPVEFTAIDGDNVVIKWTQVTPGTDDQGSRYTQSGSSVLIYAGGGKFSYEEDLLNMVHVLEDLGAARWRPQPGFVSPPEHPNRDFSRPAPA